jgi:hypothetical protein
VLGHQCDNPLCQRITTGHVVVSSALLIRRAWGAPPMVAVSQLADPRGARRRAQVLRDLPAKTQPGGG